MNLEGDLILVYYQGNPALYARIEAIEPDAKRDWYQVTLMLLTVPSQVVTWILREEYISGTPFTMGGNSVILEPVERVTPPSKPEEDKKLSKKKGKSGPATVIPFNKPDSK